MLDAIRQQISMEMSQKLTSVPPPDPAAPEMTAFGEVMITPEEPHRIEETAGRHDEDRGELGEGWETTELTDADRYEDPPIAGTNEVADTADTTLVPSAETGAEQTTAVSANAQTAESAGTASNVVAEQVARNAALLEQLNSPLLNSTSVGADSEVVAEPAVEWVAESVLAAADTQQTQAALGVTKAQEQATVQVDSELLDELVGVQDGESAHDAGSARSDEQQGQQLREATVAVRPVEVMVQTPHAEVMVANRDLSTTQTRETQTRAMHTSAEAPEGGTSSGPIPSAFDLTGMGMAGGQSSGQQSLGGDGFDGVSMDQAGPNGPEVAAEADQTESPTPNIDQLAARTVRWRHLGVLGNGGSARIRLDPPSLGSVEVMLRTDGNTVRVELTVESESVRQLMQSSTERLAQGLQSHGLQAGRIEITVDTSGESSAESQTDGQANDQSPQGDADGQDGDGDSAFQQEIDDQLNVTV